MDLFYGLGFCANELSDLFGSLSSARHRYASVLFFAAPPTPVSIAMFLVTSKYYKISKIYFCLFNFFQSH